MSHGTSKFDCSGLAKEWESAEPLRNVLRGGGNFLSGSLGEFTVKRAVENAEVAFR